MRYENFLNVMSQSMFAWNEFLKDENVYMFFLEYSSKTMDRNGRLLISQDGKLKTGINVLRQNARFVRAKNRRISPVNSGAIFEKPFIKPSDECQLTKIMGRVEENSLINQKKEFKEWCESEGLI